MFVCISSKYFVIVWYCEKNHLRIYMNVLGLISRIINHIFLVILSITILDLQYLKKPWKVAQKSSHFVWVEENLCTLSLKYIAQTRMENTKYRFFNNKLILTKKRLRNNSVSLNVFLLHLFVSDKKKHTNFDEKHIFKTTLQPVWAWAPKH